MLDFAVLPPEINSGRMYVGPGSGPMMAAAAAWDQLAAQLESFAAGYSMELADLKGHHWSGPTSEAMTAAAQPYVSWASATAAQAAQAAGQARAAAAAFETAHAATVPPTAVAANRTLLMTLLATNFFGQNLAAIAATEAHYAAMWAQDAAAMYGYAAASTQAAALPSFTKPPRATNDGGLSAQHAAAAHAAGSAAAANTQSILHAVSTVPHQAHSLASGVHTGPSPTSSGSTSGPTGYYYVNDWNSYKHVYDILSKSLFDPFVNKGVTIGDGTVFSDTLATFGRHLGLPEPGLPLLGKGGLTGSVAGADGGSLFGGLGKSVPVGSLSVPPNWPVTQVNYAAQPSAAPAQPQASATAERTGQIRLVSSAKPLPDAPLTPAVGPMQGSARRQGSNLVFRMRDRRFRVPRPVVGG
ncbi:PPE family protein [Mycobacterium sp. M1]|uniref:PPE family protein n=1 Tax=Mycolicibacter acidiphilus TaxID=2835306 RepID=A0ABS5RDR6_9MYCO|nr:PPE family protein [Mycolicibacter acidiphilus]MBS9532430.1 PPE family protein [Mycolicibacter acidiphilus]